MKGGLDRLIARVALGRHDVRPLAPTLFERNGSADEPWQGEHAIEVLAEAPAPGHVSRPSSARRRRPAGTGRRDRSATADPSGHARGGCTPANHRSVSLADDGGSRGRVGRIAAASEPA